MITTADLKAQTRRELADLARNYGVSGWHGLKKDELIKEIAKIQRQMRAKASQSASKKSPKKAPGKAPKATAKPSRKKSSVTAKETARGTEKTKDLAMSPRRQEIA